MSSKSIFLYCMLACAAGSAAAAGGGHGLMVNPDRLAWPAFQARLQLSIEPLSPAVGAIDSLASRPRTAALFGDYYVTRPYFGNAGGVRLTSGVVMGPRGAVFGPGQATPPGVFAVGALARPAFAGSSLADVGNESTQTLPYLGIGYSGSSLRGGWGFSADLGLAAQNAGALRHSRAPVGQSLDDTLREMRLTPVLQLGVSYQF